MRNKLQSIYMLHLVDMRLDALREQRMGLPEAVTKLEADAKELRTKIDDSEAALKTGALERQRKEMETLELLEKIERYKSQQLHVHTNREYDALSREIEMAEETIRRYEEEIEMFIEEAEVIREKKKEYEAQLEELVKVLDEKNEELKAILALTAEEEDSLMRLRDEVWGKIPRTEQELYTRIRNAKVRAVAPIRRGSCSGCYNVVPPQKILEIKRNNQLYVCEHCGRILISEELAGETRIDR
ncbi:MAG: C4-type zinc ribbon domain-containing protein [Bacteroidota bacterium]|nr:C4-type zinc ribbon domain-containing protein [Bacteroidota bacterium]